MPTFQKKISFGILGKTVILTNDYLYAKFQNNSCIRLKDIVKYQSQKVGHWHDLSLKVIGNDITQRQWFHCNYGQILHSFRHTRYWLIIAHFRNLTSIWHPIWRWRTRRNFTVLLVENYNNGFSGRSHKFDDRSMLSMTQYRRVTDEHTSCPSIYSLVWDMHTRLAV